MRWVNGGSFAGRPSIVETFWLAKRILPSRSVAASPSSIHIHDLILAGINIDEFFRVISQQGVAQQGEHCVRQGNADDHHDQEYNYIKEQQTAVLG